MQWKDRMQQRAPQHRNADVLRYVVLEQQHTPETPGMVWPELRPMLQKFSDRNRQKKASRLKTGEREQKSARLRCDTPVHMKLLLRILSAKWKDKGESVTSSR